MKASLDDSSDAVPTTGQGFPSDMADKTAPATGSATTETAGSLPTTKSNGAPAGELPPPPATQGRGRRIAGFFGTAHGLLLVIGAIFLGIFVTMVPPGYGLDEQTHFYRMYQISQGRLFPEYDADQQKFVANIPRPIYDLLQQGWGDSNSVRRDLLFYHRKDIPDPAVYSRLGDQPIDPNDVVEADITQTLPNFPIVYFASAAGTAVARALGVDAGGIVLVAKICAALMYLGLAFLAVWFARRLRFRWLVLTAALLPAAIFQASVISADTFANGMALLFVSIAVTLMVERRPVGTGTLVLLAGAAAGVVLSKPTYALLVVLIAVLPAEIFRSRSTGRLYKAAVLVGALVLIALTLYIANKGTVAINSQRPADAASISAIGQLKDLLAHPAHVFVVVATTIVYYSASWVQGVVGLFGYNTIEVPSPFVYLAVVTLALAAFHAERLRPLPAWALFIAGVAVSGAIIMTFYLTFSVIGAESAIGIQGRYFIPCVVAVALGAASLVPANLVMRQAAARWLFTSLATVILAVATATYAIALY